MTGKHLLYGALGAFGLYLVFGPKPLPRGSKILLIGDSLAVGLTAPMKARLEAAGYVFASHAQVGTRINQWAPQMRQLLTIEKPAAVFVSLGTNDSALYNPMSEERDLLSLVSDVAEAGAKLVWIGPPTLPPSLKGQDTVRAMIANAVPRVLDSRTMSFERAADRIHSTPSGYASWASQILAAARDVVRA